jgi:hypothetical protein
MGEGRKATTREATPAKGEMGWLLVGREVGDDWTWGYCT